MLALSLATVGLVARLSVAAPPPAGDATVQADKVRYDVETGKVVLEGNARVRRGAIVLRARSATYDPTTGEVRAAGGVLLTDATHVIAADGVRAILGGDVEAEGVVALVKGERVDLSKASTVSEARRIGWNRLSVSGARLSGDPERRFRLDDARLTLCDCGEGKAPSWEIAARTADVVPGHHAVLHSAVLRFNPGFDFLPPIPILNPKRELSFPPLPWFYVPLGERQTGLLLPEIRSTGATGFTIGEPVFVTLGRSADSTITPEYSFGGPSADSEQAKTTGAVRGPGARLELRWAPAEAAEGRAEVGYLHDFDREPPFPVTSPSGILLGDFRAGTGGDRLALDGFHSQRLGASTTLRTTIHLYGDPWLIRDMTNDEVVRLTPYRRSDALVSTRQDAAVIEAGGSYLQPFPAGGLLPVGVDYGKLGASLDASSRWLGATATVPPIAAGPLRLSGHAGLARFAPVSLPYDSASRPAADRADARAEIAMPLVLGDALGFAPYLRSAAVGYAFEAARDPRASAWVVGGAVLSTEVSRRYGETRHAIAPRLEWRAGTGAAGGNLEWPAYDPYDRSSAGLVPGTPGTFNQLRAAVDTRLQLQGRELLRAEIGQDIDLSRGHLAETFGSGSFATGRFAASGSVRFFPTGRGDGTPTATVPSLFLDRFSELGVNVSVSDARGDALTGGFYSIGPGGSGTLVTSLDPLFDSRAAPLDAGSYAAAGARVVAGGASLRYDAALYGRPQKVASCSDPSNINRQVEGWSVRQHVATLEWSSPCRCFRALVILSVNDCGVFTYRASVDLSQLAAARGVR